MSFRWLALCALLVGCRGQRTGPADPLPEVRCLPGRVQRGMSYVHSWGEHGARGYGSATSQASLRELRGLAVDWISLMPFGFMPALSADAVRLASRHPGAESDDRVRREVAAAHALGIKVLLKPHLWIGGGAWTGEIAPRDDAAWGRLWESYRAFVLHYAALAEASGADLLAVGVELPTLTARLEPRWRQLIREVRGRYRGPLTYCANWDEAARVGFWDQLDFIGVQFYAPLAAREDEGPAAMQRRLREHLAPLGALSQRLRRPVLFTEVGYKSVRGTALQPHLWPEQLKGEVQVDLQAQAAAYQLFLGTIRELDYVQGLYPWKWFSDPETQEEGPAGFAVRGKPALQVLQRAYAPCRP